MTDLVTTSREALAKAIHDMTVPVCPHWATGSVCERQADALLSSGAVRSSREWASDGILRAALTHALEHYSGPDDDTVPVLRGWLARLDTEATR